MGRICDFRPVFRGQGWLDRTPQRTHRGVWEKGGRQFAKNDAAIRAENGGADTVVDRIFRYIRTILSILSVFSGC
jgi:hypothetical protein